MRGSTRQWCWRATCVLSIQRAPQRRPGYGPELAHRLRKALGVHYQLDPGEFLDSVLATPSGTNPAATAPSWPCDSTPNTIHAPPNPSRTRHT